MQPLGVDVSMTPPMWSACSAAVLVLFVLPGSPESELEDLLRIHAERASAGDVAAANRALEELEKKQRSYGMKNLPFASAFLMHEAKVAHASDDPHALFLAEAAVKLSPDLSAAHALLLQLNFENRSSTFRQRAAIAADYLRAIFATRAPFANLLAYAGLAAFATLLLFVLIQLIKYTKLIGLWLPLLMAAPPALNLGVATSAVLVLSAVFAVQSRRERHLTLLAFLFAAGGTVAIDLAVAWALELDDASNVSLARQLAAPFAGQLPAWAMALIAALAALAANFRGPLLAASTPPKRRAYFAVIPGLNDMIADRPLIGAILFFIFCTALAAIYWLEGVVPNPDAVGVELPWILTKLFLAANTIVVLILISTRRVAS
jgi:hypothetical protein